MDGTWGSAGSPIAGLQAVSVHLGFRASVASGLSEIADRGLLVLLETLLTASTAKPGNAGLAHGLAAVMSSLTSHQCWPSFVLSAMAQGGFDWHPLQGFCSPQLTPAGQGPP